MSQVSSRHLVLIIAMLNEDLNLETVAKINCPHFFCMNCIRTECQRYISENPQYDENGNENLPYEI